MWGFPSCFCKSCRCFGTHIGFVPNLCAWRYHIYYYVFFKNKKTPPRNASGAQVTSQYKPGNVLVDEQSATFPTTELWNKNRWTVGSNVGVNICIYSCFASTKKPAQKYWRVKKIQCTIMTLLHCLTVVHYIDYIRYCKYKKTPKGRYTPDAVNCLT